jgi:thiol-disulfide isomerase/thioredoxin
LQPPLRAPQVEYYAPWCKYCQQFAPQYVKVAKALQGLALVAAVNCDEKENARLCRAADIQGFPSIKVGGRRAELLSWGAAPRQGRGCRPACPTAAQPLQLPSLLGNALCS